MKQFFSLLFALFMLASNTSASVTYNGNILSIAPHNYSIIPYASEPSSQGLARQYQLLDWRPLESINFKDYPLDSYLLMRLDVVIQAVSDSTVLFYDITSLSDATVYLMQGDHAIGHWPIGAIQPLSKREIKTAFPHLVLPALEPGHYSLLFHTNRRNHHSLANDGWLLPKDLLTQHVLQQNTYLGGSMIGAMLTYLVLAGVLLWNRYSTNLVYGCLFLIGVTLTVMLRAGVLYQATRLDSPWIYAQLQPAAYALFIGSATLYFRQRLGWDSWKKILPVIVGSLGWANLLFALIIVVAGETLFIISILLSMATSMVSISILTIGTLPLYWSGKQLDKFTATVWLLLFLCTILRTFRFSLDNSWPSETALYLNFASIICAAWIIVEAVIVVIKEELQRRQQMYMTEGRIELVNRLSHELRTPLNAVIGLTDLLKEHQSPKATQQYAQMIQNAGRNLLSLVNDILDFSKLSNKRLKLAEEPFRIDRVLLDCIIGFLPQQMEKGILPHIDIEPSCPFFLRGDAHRLRQILDNLISNAYKFTQKGDSIQLTIKPGNCKANKQQLLITVKDTGRGIPEDQIASIFEPYEQVLSTDATQYKGTGLGLPITKLLVEEMGGSISVRSTPLVSTEFYCEIWFNTAEQQPDLTTLFSSLKDKHFLFAVTNPGLIKPITDYLKYWGAHTHLIKIGQQPIETAHLDALVIHTDHLSDTPPTDWLLSIQAPVIFSMASHITDALQSHQSHVVQISPFSSALDYLAAFASELGDTEIILPSSDQQAEITLEGKDHYVLLVDDNPINLTVTNRLLNSLGVKCDNVDSGRAALSQLESAPDKYTLMLLDCEMPDMDGFIVAERWRNHEQHYQLKPMPIVALTAHALDEIDQRCLEHGMDDVLHKPVNKQHLANMLGRFA